MLANESLQKPSWRQDLEKAKDKLDAERAEKQRQDKIRFEQEQATRKASQTAALKQALGYLGISVDPTEPLIVLDGFRISTDDIDTLARFGGKGIQFHLWIVKAGQDVSGNFHIGKTLSVRDIVVENEPGWMKYRAELASLLSDLEVEFEDTKLKRQLHREEQARWEAEEAEERQRMVEERKQRELERKRQQEARAVQEATYRAEIATKCGVSVGSFDYLVAQLANEIDRRNEARRESYDD